MRLYNEQIYKYQSYRYSDYYSIKKHLIDIYPKCRLFVVPTTFKGIGKSYSTWNEIIIPDINNLGLGAIYCRWTKPELNAFITEIKEKPWELLDKLNCETEWTKRDEITILRNKHTKQPLIYFTIPSWFGVLKGITIQGDLPIKNFYWDEFLTTRNIYIKPQETLDSLWQLFGSIFRKQDYFAILTANNVNPNNPFLVHMFYNLGWPNVGETLVDYNSLTVIDSPWQSSQLISDYEKSTFYKMSRLTPKIHSQLFQQTDFDDTYENIDMILYRLEAEVSYIVSVITEDNMIYHFVNFNDEGKDYIYVTPQDIDCELEIYASSFVTQYKTSYTLIPRKYVRFLIKKMENKEIFYRDTFTMTDVVDRLLLSNEFYSNEPIDWTQKGGR